MKGNNACQKEQHSEWEIAVFCIVALGVLLTFNILIFRNSRDSLLKLQEDNMLATAKTVANSLQNFYDREMEELTLYFNEELEDSEIRSYCEGQDTISYVALLDKGGKLKYSYGKDYDPYVEKELEEYLEYDRKEGKSHQGRLLPAVLTEKNHYTQFLVSPAGTTGMDGWAIAAIEMDYVYAKIVKPVQIGENGYSMVKQLDGTILMHPSQSQIGLDAIDGRKEVYKEYDLQYDDLEQWIQDQRENQEGSGLLVGGQRKTDAIHESDFVYPEADRRGDLDHQLYAEL